MAGAATRGNVIRGYKMGRSSTGGTNGKPLPEEENTSDITPLGDVVDTVETDTTSATSPGAQDSAAKRHKRKGGKAPVDFFKQKDFFSGPLLPSEVCYFATVSLLLSQLPLFNVYGCYDMHFCYLDQHYTKRFQC